MKLILTLILFLFACGGRLAIDADSGRVSDVPSPGEVQEEDGGEVVRGPGGERDASHEGLGAEGGRNADSGEASETRLSSCGTGRLSWVEYPFILCTDWYGNPGTDLRCQTDPYVGIQENPDFFGVHPFPGPCPTKGAVGQCERTVTLYGNTYRSVETFVLSGSSPFGDSESPEEFRVRCEANGGRPRDLP